MAGSNLRGQVVAVLGASGALGSETASLLGRAGASLILHGRRLPTRYEGTPLPPILVQGDLRRPATRRLLSEAAKASGRLDGLLVTVGEADYHAFAALDDDHIARLIDVNLTAPILAVRALLPHFLSKQSGSIVLVSSIWGVCAASGEVAYAAAKAGLVHFGRSLAEELRPSGIRVNTICPRAFISPMLEPIGASEVARLEASGDLVAIGDIAAACASYLNPDDERTGEVASL